MSPSVNKHFQYVENNILARSLLHQDVMNAMHLSQPPVLLLAADRLPQPNNYLPPYHQRQGFCCFFSIIASQFHRIISNEPTAPFIYPPHMPQIPGRRPALCQRACKSYPLSLLFVNKPQLFSIITRPCNCKSL